MKNVKKNPYNYLRSGINKYASFLCIGLVCNFYYGWFNFPLVANK